MILNFLLLFTLFQIENKKPIIPEKPKTIEKITLNKLDPRDLANIIRILNIDQFSRFKQ